MSRIGAYVVDDLLPQPNLPEGHQMKVDALVAAIDASPSCATGIQIASRRPAAPR